MESTQNIEKILAHISVPAFYVSGGVVLCVNHGAQQYGLKAGAQIRAFLGSAYTKYEQFTQGTMRFTMQFNEQDTFLSVTKLDGADLFTIEPEEDEMLRALSLAAMQLRRPLSDLMAITETDFFLEAANAPQSKIYTSQVIRSLLQMNRQIGNMADAAYFCKKGSALSLVAFDSFVSEIMGKAATYLEAAQIKLVYEGLPKEQYVMAQRASLERALYNMIGNAVKFLDRGSTVKAYLTKTDTQLCLSVENEVKSSVSADPFRMYQRQPGIEDIRLGTGLGMELVNKVARFHNGSVLIDHPSDHITRTTLTIAIQHPGTTVLRSSEMQYSDYNGGIDRALLELSDVLPATLYSKI